MAIRHKLQDTRSSLTRKIEISGFDIYLILSFFSNNQPAEMFLNIGKEGSTLSGLLNGCATVVSIGLQYGVPLSRLMGMWANMKFEPVSDEYQSILDAISREAISMASEFGAQPDKDHALKDNTTTYDGEQPTVTA